MAGEVFRFVGAVSGESYGDLCLPAADDYETALALNEMYKLIKEKSRWADRENLVVSVVFPETVQLSKI